MRKHFLTKIPDKAMTRIISCLCFLLFTCSIYAQQWIPDDITATNLLVERYKYQDPNMTLLDIEEEYEVQKDDFVSSTNDNLENYNDILDSMFTAYQHDYNLAVFGKIEEDYPDKNVHRYILRRDVFFGNKRVLNPESGKLEDDSYIAYRYYFYDRLTKESYPPYYFSGDQWAQIKRIIYWLNIAE